MNTMPAFKKIHAERLRAIAQHLSYGKLSKVKFDFSRVNRGKRRGESCRNDECGYAGCALGEFHKIFPEKFAGKYFVGIGSVVLGFLGLTIVEARHLFAPNFQDLSIPGNLLGVSATRFQVAANIRKFVKHKGF